MLATTGKEIGFTSSKNEKMMNFAEEILTIAKESCSVDDGTIWNKDEIFGKYVDAATYGNVSRLRTYENRIWNVGYFFNSGSLDSDDLVNQLLIVLLLCGFVELQIKLQMFDAGWANSRLIRVLSKKYDITNSRCTRTICFEVCQPSRSFNKYMDFNMFCAWIEMQ